MSGSVLPCENMTAGCRLGWRAGDQSSSTRSKLLLLVNTFLRVLKTSAIENQLILENRNNYTWIEAILFSSHIPCYNQHCLRVVFALHFSLIYSHHTTQPVFWKGFSCKIACSFDLQEGQCWWIFPLFRHFCKHPTVAALFAPSWPSP